MRPAGGAARRASVMKGVIVLSVCVGPDRDGESTPQDVTELGRLVPVLGAERYGRGVA